jgi:serine/threonine protein kinase
MGWAGHRKTLGTRLAKRPAMRAAGDTVGNFVLRHPIAEGGMGSIWAAEQMGLGREVALKFLSGAVAERPGVIERFNLEARTLARVNSPHSPQVFDHGVCEDGTPYIAMELIAGTELREWVGQRGPMSLAQVTRLVEQVALALTAAHELGIVHRDIKPDNILLSGGDDDFHVKLIDFGIAKSLLSKKGAFITQVGASVGTPDYMSPEQVSGSTSIDERTDVWSLGVVAYWCFTRALPFEADGSTAVFLSILNGALKPVSTLRPDLPVGIDEWFDQALSRDVNGRFATAALMSRGLADATAARPTWTEAIPLVQKRTRDSRPTRPARVRRAAQFLTLAAAVAIVLAAGSRLKPAQVQEARVATDQIRSSVVSMVSRVGALGESSDLER